MVLGLIAVSAAGCGADAIAPTRAPQKIDVSTTWDALSCPVEVEGDVVVAGPDRPVLTIMAGCTITRPEGAEDFARIVIGDEKFGGALVIAGTEDAPVAFEKQVGLVLRDRTDDHVTSLQHFALDIDHQSRFAIEVHGVRPVIKNAEIGGGRYGIVFVEGASFGEGSGGLTFSANNKSGIMIAANEVRTIPLDTFFEANTNAGVELAGDLHVRDTATWPAFSQRYAFKGDLIVGGPSTPKLTLAAGVQLDALETYVSSSYLEVGVEEPGALAVEGTMDDKVWLYPDALFNDGVGIRFGPLTDSVQTWIENVVLTDGFIAIHGADPTLRHVELTGTPADDGTGRRIGLMIGPGARLGSSSTDLTIRGGVEVLASAVASLPADSTYHPAITVLGTPILADARWRKLNVEYQVRGRITVSSPNAPQLVLEPGVVLQFTDNEQSGITIGAGAPGALCIEGNREMPVVMYGSHDMATQWSLRFGPQTIRDRSAIEFAVFAQGGLAVGMNGLIETDDAPISIKNSLLKASARCGIWARCSREGLGPQLEGIIYDGNATGDLCNDGC